MLRTLTVLETVNLCLTDLDRNGDKPFYLNGIDADLFEIMYFCRTNLLQLLNMETALLSSESKSDMKLLLQLAKKLGVKIKSLSQDEIEEWVIAKRIESGIKSGKATIDQVMQALES